MPVRRMRTKLAPRTPLMALAMAAALGPCVAVLPAAAVTPTPLCPSASLSSGQLKALIDTSWAATVVAAANGVVVTSYGTRDGGVSAGHRMLISVGFDALRHRAVELNAINGEAVVARTVTGRSPSDVAYVHVPSNDLEVEAMKLLHLASGWKDRTSAWDTDGLADAASFLAINPFPDWPRTIDSVLWEGATGTCASSATETVVRVVQKQFQVGDPGQPAEYIRRQDLRLAPSGAFRSVTLTTSADGVTGTPERTTATYKRVSVRLPAPSELMSSFTLTSATDSVQARSMLQSLTWRIADRARQAAAAAQRAPTASDVFAAALAITGEPETYSVIRRSDGVQVQRIDPLGGGLLSSRIFVTSGGGIRTTMNFRGY
jgi:hypothetical protein